MCNFQVLVVLSVTLAAAEGQTFHLGSCPRPSVQENLNVSQYMGVWYEIEKLPAAFERGKCVQASYSLLSDGTVNVYNSEILSDGTVNSIQGVAKVKDPSQPAVLSVSFFKGFPSSPYMVLSTDYHSYSLVYSCSQYFGLFHVDFAWILARTPALTADVIGRLHEDLATSAAAVDAKQLIVTDQTGCDIIIN
ncbi:apolipoprotein D-like [Cynoglossus semilaevis]|uniref:Apolipoprotein D n=1 Tax=Cynoglossus semilaevis TaxID=244447 RepID=A0A3P8UCY4_CYNSE|nr:apolipoprotein D-like [Cynoglossus semilaevis]